MPWSLRAAARRAGEPAPPDVHSRSDAPPAARLRHRAATSPGGGARWQQAPDPDV